MAVATSSVWRFYDRHEITFKKVLHAAEQDRPDGTAAREELKAEQPALKASRLLFIDETAVTTKMTRLYGRATCAPTRLRVREAIEAAGAELRYLPAYSPDLNPIENAYTKIKSDLRKGAARTVHALWKLVGRSVKAIAPSECAGYFRNTGYRA
jgi:transposase